jgi:hypothetical protein
MMSPDGAGDGQDESEVSASESLADLAAGGDGEQSPAGSIVTAGDADERSAGVDELTEDDAAALAAAEFARAPHQWSLPAYGPTNDTAVYRQIIGYLGPPPMRKPPRGLVVGCGVMVTLFVAMIGMSGLFALRLARAQVSQRESAVSVAASIALFCEAAQNRDYSGAYRYLSPAFQARMSVDAFVAANETHDETDGAITSCTSETDLLHTSVAGARTSVSLAVTRSHTATGTISLTRGGDGWRIDTLDTALELD